MILNNLTGARSKSTNCEPDKCTALLYDVHDLILQQIDSVDSTETDKCSAEMNDEYGNILCDPVMSKKQLSLLESGSLTHAACEICDKIVDQSHCEPCQINLQTDTKLNGKQRKDLFGLKYPSPDFIKIFEKIFTIAMEVVPLICSEKLIKTILIQEVKKRIDDDSQEMEVYNFHMIGCMEHNEETVRKVFDLTVTHVLNIFCKNINDLLSGKVKTLPPDPTPIQDLARSFNVKKKRIGKFTAPLQI